uniref:Uncharacterized protein n=1 Tax=Salix viminalis TaxID=40686 RepID=A0A6N2LBZ7_SALVM
MNPSSVPNIPSWHPLVQKKLGRLIQVTEEKESEAFFLSSSPRTEVLLVLHQQASNVAVLALFVCSPSAGGRYSAEILSKS